MLNGAFPTVVRFSQRVVITLCDDVQLLSKMFSGLQVLCLLYSVGSKSTTMFQIVLSVSSVNFLRPVYKQWMVANLVPGALPLT